MGMVTNTEAKTYVSLVAKIVRIITIPPFMILVLLIVLYFSEKESFAGRYDMIIAVIGLVLIPLAAYPVHRIIPVLFNGGRKKQRKLAFIFSLVGYVICFAYVLSHGTVRIKQIFFTYFITVVMLTIFNRLLGIRVSGHAASSIAPCFFCFFFWVCICRNYFCNSSLHKRVGIPAHETTQACGYSDGSGVLFNFICFGAC